MMNVRYATVADEVVDPVEMAVNKLFGHKWTEWHHNWYCARCDITRRQWLNSEEEMIWVHYASNGQILGEGYIGGEPPPCKGPLMPLSSSEKISVHVIRARLPR